MANLVSFRLPGLPSVPSPHRKATIRSVDGRLAMTIPLVDPETDFEDLGQSWATITRDPNIPVTVHRGPKLARATLRMRMIATDRQQSIDHEVMALKAICDSVSPVVVSYGSLEAKMTRSGGWVVQSGSVHVSQRVSGSNDARWAEATLELLEAADFQERRYFAPSTVQAATAARTTTTARTTASGGRVPATYTWRQGDTLFAVALRLYGDAARWIEIGDLNKVRDPKAITPGQVLRLP